MARGVRVVITAHGFKQAAEHLDEAQVRLFNLSDPFKKGMRSLEDAEKRHFARLGGRYVDSGDLFRSLTRRSGRGTIRRLHKQGLEFGTSLFYSVFLTKRRREPEAHQIKPRGKRKGRSAVVVMNPRTKKRIGDLLLDHVMEPFGAGR